MSRNVLVITGDRNTHGKKDYTGAFEPEAKRFMSTIPGDHCLIRIDVSKNMKARREQLIGQLMDLGDAHGHNFTDIAFFMHGWPKGIQCGLYLQHIGDFVETALDHVLIEGDSFRPNHIILYCCLTGDAPGAHKADEKKLGPGGDGGFADLMRDEFCFADAKWTKIFAHTTTGHTTRNPFVRIFEGKGSSVGCVDGDWLIRPPKKGRASPLWGEWRKALWSRKPYDTGTFRMPTAIRKDSCERAQYRDFRFFAPFMTIEELHFALTTCG